MSDEMRHALWPVRLAAVGIVAAASGWFVNQAIVWQLGQYAPEPSAAPMALPEPTLPPSPSPAAPAPTPVVPEMVVEQSPAITDTPAPPAEAPADKPRPKHRPKKKAKPRPPRPKKASSEPKVRVFTVDQKKMASQFKSPADTAGHGRVVPNWVDGERRGMKFIDVAPDGIFSRLGIQNGDVVMSVNGIEITTQQKALEDFQKMRNKRTFDATLERGGKQVRHRYILK